MTINQPITITAPSFGIKIQFLKTRFNTHIRRPNEGQKPTSQTKNQNPQRQTLKPPIKAQLHNDRVQLQKVGTVKI